MPLNRNMLDMLYEQRTTLMQEIERLSGIQEHGDEIEARAHSTGLTLRRSYLVFVNKLIDAYIQEG